MKNLLVAFFLFAVIACTATNKQTTVRSIYDRAADVDLFLSTSDENVENQVLDRLKSHDVDSAQIKQLLGATLPVFNQGSVGLQSNLKLKINEKTYSYALYVPESAKRNIPMIVIMHGMGGVAPIQCRNGLNDWKTSLSFFAPPILWGHGGQKIQKFCFAINS